MRCTVTLALAALGILLPLTGASAACVGTFLQAAAIEDCLDQQPPAPVPPTGGQTRGWSARNLNVTRKDPPPEAPAVVNLWVNFAFDSAELTTDARITLDELAKALRGARLEGKAFILAGHTDAVGTAEYNQSLSERRANAVRDYLVSSGQVSPNRLKAEGWGFSRPMNADDPKAAENRRVEVKVAQ
jgi:outer membrane protein OmpA-like peptidoglycan-associated protein